MAERVELQVQQQQQTDVSKKGLASDIVARGLEGALRIRSLAEGLMGNGASGASKNSNMPNDLEWTAGKLSRRNSEPDTPTFEEQDAQNCRENGGTLIRPSTLHFDTEAV